MLVCTEKKCFMIFYLKNLKIKIRDKIKRAEPKFKTQRKSVRLEAFLEGNFKARRQKCWTHGGSAPRTSLDNS